MSQGVTRNTFYNAYRQYHLHNLSLIVST